MMVSFVQIEFYIKWFQYAPFAIWISFRRKSVPSQFCPICTSAIWKHVRSECS